jgi:hypothetical protein
VQSNLYFSENAASNIFSFYIYNIRVHILNIHTNVYNRKVEGGKDNMFMTNICNSNKLKCFIYSKQGLWRGYSATLLRDVPFSAIYWPCYEFLRPQRYNFVETFLAGAFAGTVASTVTLPMDVIKTRLQIELGENIVNSSNNGNTRFVSRVMICQHSNLINIKYV